MNFIPQQNINNNNNRNLNETMKMIYALIGGIQSIINIFASFLDIFYIISILKSLLFDNLIWLIKSLIISLKKLLSFNFIENSYKRKISNIIFQLSMILTIILLYLIKNIKEKELKEKLQKEIN
jgi:hypothetical protein